MQSGITESGSPINDGDRVKNYLSELSPDVLQDIGIPITRGMMLTFNFRRDLQKHFDISEHKGRIAYTGWWLRVGSSQNPLTPITDEQIRALSENASEIIQDASLPITRAMVLFLHGRQDLIDLFDLSTKKGREGYVQWWMQSGITEFGSPDKLCGGELSKIHITQKEIDIKSNNVPVKGEYQTGGINLIGLVRGELGIGEEVRMASKALMEVNIQFSMFNFPRQSSSRQSDMSLAHHIKSELVYEANMVNLTGFEYASLLIEIGKDVFDKRYTIGAWPWELPIWPRQCDVVFKLVDEIWASTMYVARAYSNSQVPVIHMPTAVDYNYCPERKRSEFGLSEQPYLFLFVFDGLSHMARKNPIAHIKTFWMAFPKSRKDVGLVVKTMNILNGDEEWNEFMRLARQDERIHVIKETMTKYSLLQLMNSCDAFISLHRAEGFGRCIAEMMWLGKPVIVTNYSGNTDFTNTQTAFLVDGPIVDVKQDEYIFADGQKWCDPDINMAAEQMRRCYEDDKVSRKIALAGKDYIKREYCFKAVGLRYKKRLKELGLA